MANFASMSIFNQGVLMLSQNEIEAEKKIVEQKIRDCIEWPFPEKNIDRLDNSISHNDDFFIYHPDSKSTVKNYDEFKKTMDIFVTDICKPTRTDITELEINISKSGDAAWFRCMLDDEGLWDGKKYAWLNCRWTGVLEKQDDEWKIVQMHISLPTDQKN